jgi:ceramide glucosyltransferase
MHATIAGEAARSALAGLRLLSLVSGVFTLLFAAASAVAGRALLGRLRAAPRPASLPPVTVIKPLKDAEGGLYENLATFCRQDYPCWQLLLCLQSPDDPALAVAQRLKRDFPDVDMEIVVSKNRVGYNPKVNNMANAYPFAKYDLLLMSDSDISAAPDLLRAMASPFADPGVGLTTAFYQAVGGRGFWGALEALSVNAHFLPQALCAGAFGMRFAMGAAMMVRRQAFEASGAYANLADHLADDFWLGESVVAAGWRLEFAGTVVDTVPDISGGLAHFRHLTRWARTIRVCQPGGYAASLIQHGFSLLTLRLLLVGSDARALFLLGALWAVKAAASAGVAAEIGGRRSLAGLLLLPVSEWLSFAAWIAGWGSTQVVWRGQTYDVQPHGRLTPVAVLPRPAAVEP